MSQDIEIDPDSRTIKYYDSRTEQSIRDFIESGGKVLSRTDAITLLDEIDRLRKDCAHYKQAALDISDVNDHMRKQIDDQNRRMQDLFLKTELLEKLIPPETERGPGFVGQGSWSVFAEKVVAERDAAQDRVKQLVDEKIDLCDELSGLCEEIRCLKEENDELREGMRLLGNATASKKEHSSIQGLLRQNSELHRDNAGLQEEVTRCGTLLAAKKEHTNVHFNDKDSFVGVTGYGQFSLKQVDKDRWEIHMLNEKVTLYNKKGHRVRGHHNYDGDW
jgi:DNA repair exonuclease SbcCD ATPase subunit